MITSEDLRKLADAVCFDEPELAPSFDWSKDPAIIITDALREAADQIERLQQLLDGKEFGEHMFKNGGLF